MLFPPGRLGACKTDTENRSTLRTADTKRCKCVEEKELHQAGVHLERPIDSRAKTS